MAQENPLSSLFEQGLVWFAEGNKGSHQAYSLFSEERFAHLSQKTLSKRTLKARASFGIPAIDGFLPEACNFSCGQVHEWFWRESSDSQKTQTLTPPCSILSFLAARMLSQESAAFSPIIWIGKESWPSPYALEQAFSAAGNFDTPGILKQFLFVDTALDKSRFWAIETALRSSAPLLVIANSDSLPIRSSLFRRLALAAQKGNTLCFLIRNATQLRSQSFASARWLIAPLVSPTLWPRWQLNLLKCKGGLDAIGTKNWVLEYEADYEKVSLHIPPDVVERVSSDRSLSQTQATQTRRAS